MSSIPKLRLVPRPAPDSEPQPLALVAPLAPRKRKKGKRLERGQSKHPGVVVIRPRAGRPYYALRHVEPETGVERTPRLHNVTTPKAAEKAAMQLWKNLERRKLQVTVAGGRAHASSVSTLRQEIETYLTAVKHKVSKRGKRTSAITLQRYRSSLEQWASWSEKRDCMQLNQLVRPALSEWVSTRLGTLSLTVRGEPRKISTINQEVKPVRQMLIAAALAGRLVHLNSDAIRGGLKRLTQEATVPRCYSVPEIRDALRAALDFDVSPRKSKRSAPTAPVVAAGLLGGLRRGELALLQVHDVLFDAPSEYNPSITTGVDVIRLPKHKVKTGVERDVQMAPYSPLLGELMRELIRGRAGHERVFRMSYQAIGSLSKRLRAGGRTPPEGFCMKDLRSTCATYQSPLPGNAKAKADRLGHTLAVAEEHYLALPSGTPVTAPDLETVMQCEPELREIIARLRAARGAPLIGKATKATRSVRPGTMRSAAAAPQKKATRGKS